MGWPRKKRSSIKSIVMNGFTKEEAFLNTLGKNSFLRFWSWANLFRDQDTENGKSDGKEICDLTVIFGNHILLFSDKKIEFCASKPLEIAWSRWSRKAIADSVSQIKGARRWLKKFPDRVYLDKKCKTKIPIKIQRCEEIKFHNIVVCHGIENILAEFNSESSFVFDTTIRGDGHWDYKTCKPFCIGQIYEDDFVHAFNESTIALVLNEFDTTKDFIHYLSKRELLLSSKKAILARSEADIIQLYYENFDEVAGGRSTWSTDFDTADKIIIDMGGISKLFNNSSYSKKKQDDRVSYFWDDLINCFSFHILNNTSEHQNWLTPDEIEPSIRYMAETSRFERRILADSFIEFYQKVTPNQRGTRLSVCPTNKTSAYLFLILPYNPSASKSHDEYREVRRHMLEDYCIINKLLNPELTQIIGIACKTRDIDQNLSIEFFSEGQDFLYMDLSEWSDKENKSAQNIHDEYIENKWLSKRDPLIKSISEFS